MAETLERVMSLETRFDTFEADLGGIRESGVRVEDRVGHVEVRLGQVEDRLGQVEVRLGQVEVRLGRVEVHLGLLDARVGQVEVCMGRLEDAMIRLDERMFAGFSEIRMTQRSDLRWILGGVAGSAVAVILSMFGMMFLRGPF